MSPEVTKPVCAIVGVGPGIGEALARRFSAAGYALALLARSVGLTGRLAAELPDARAYECDVGNEVQVGQVFSSAGKELGPVEVMVFNAGKGIWGTIDSVTTTDFEAAWRTNTLGLFLAARAVTASMTARKSGSIVVTGATASMRGTATAAAFAPAKTAQRALAQSMARHLGSQGIHVAHIVIDGIVGGPETRAQFPDRADDSFIDPDRIAEAALGLVRQPPSAWSFEIDIRPFNERW